VSKSKIGHEKALWAVDTARRFFQAIGYSVPIPNHVCANGPDIAVTMPNRKVIHVEVKLAMWNKKAWRVNRVTRKKDEFIAIVFPSGFVHVDEMKDHLKLCCKSGDRYLTALGRLFE
jgi:hypothetical protein